MAKRVTIQDVALEAGVSITTVSRYLNQRYEAMSDETKLRIEQVIEALNYRPNALARGLKANKTRTVAIVVVNIGYPFCVALIRSLTSVLTAHGYNLLVCESAGNQAHEADLIHSLQAQQVDGLILQTNGGNNKLLEELAKQIPVLLVDRAFSIPHVTSVVTNNEEASYDLTSHLFRIGYERIFYVTEEPADLMTRVGRLKGYERACVEFERDPYTLYVNRDDLTTFDDATEAIRTQAVVPFAVYTANGLIMIELYSRLLSLGFPIPSKLGLATFDEPDWIKVVRPSLTCISQPVEAMGRRAAELVLRDMAETSGRKRGKVETISSLLLLGESTKISQN